jgi:hypothetical protein
MKNSTLLLLIILFIFISGCEKEKSDNVDWKATDNRFLILDSNNVDYNTRAKLVRINDSELLFYGYNPYYLRSCFYKLIINNDNLSIKNMKPMIDGNPADIQDVSFPSSSVGFLLMVDSEVQNQSGYVTKLLKTLDGGESWNILNFQNTISYVHFITPDSGIVISADSWGSNYSIYSSTDGGNNWQMIANDYFNYSNHIDKFYFIPNKPRICFTLTGDKIFYSTNGGFTWQLHSTIRADITSMSFLNENEGFVFNYSYLAGSPCTSTNTIYKVDQIGGAFKQMYKVDDMILKIEALSENEVYFSQFLSSTVFCTYDGFKTVKRTTIQDPIENVAGDRLVTDFTLYQRFGVLTDMKGTLYLKNN